MKRNLPTSYKDTGFQAYVGWYKSMWPFVSLCLFEEYLALSLWPKTYILNYSDIESITDDVWFLVGGRGIRIKHHDSTVPADIGYWSFNKNALLKEFRKRNVKVSVNG